MTDFMKQNDIFHMPGPKVHPTSKPDLLLLLFSVVRFNKQAKRLAQYYFFERAFGQKLFTSITLSYINCGGGVGELYAFLCPPAYPEIGKCILPLFPTRPRTSF